MADRKMADRKMADRKFEEGSGAKGARTPDLLNAIQALFQTEL
jgi:hypothetical protein